MKKQGSVRQKLKQVMFRHRSKYVEEGMKRRPANCAHNEIVQVHDPSSANRAGLRICLYGVSSEDHDRWNNRTCDESLGGLEQCRQCPMFKNRSTSEDLKAEFATMLGAGDIGWIAKQYPDVAALMWVLDSETQSTGSSPKPKDKSENILAFFGGVELNEAEIPDEPLASDD
jgi:hypothetical protein